MFTSERGWINLTAIGSMLFGGVFGFALHFFATHDWLSAWESAVLIGFAMFSCGILWKCWFLLLDGKERLATLIEKQDVMNPISDKYKHLDHCHPFIRDIGLHTIRTQIDSIKAINNGFAIGETDWVMRANTNFWRKLNELISSTSDLRGRACYAVHSGNPNIWNDQDAHVSLNAQLEFNQKGGQVHRIIIGDFSYDEVKAALIDSLSTTLSVAKIEADRVESDVAATPTAKDYAETLRIMDKYNVQVYYYKGRIRSDFAVLALDGHELVMQWFHTVGERQVDECRFFVAEGEEYRDRWDQLRTGARAFVELSKSVEAS
jgi:hypothetical protein